MADLDLDLLNAHAQALWGRWTALSQAEGYTAAETVRALEGGLAEMIRANIPQAAWEDHLANVVVDIRYILTGIAPTETIGDSRAKRPRARRQRPQPKSGEPHQDAAQKDPDPA